MKAKKIISITSDGLTYQSHTGKPVFVDFEVCKNNFSKWLQNENRLTEERREVELITKSVAIRDAFSKPKYIEFFSNPRVRFEFKKTLFKNDYKEFRKLVERINEVGWKTFDMG